MKEYNVILHAGIDYDGFWNDMESDTDGGKLYIPNRAVQYTNERPASLRQCWYLLTDEEAEILRKDERVLGVEIPPEYRTDIQIGLRERQSNTFTKTTSDSGEFVNWGLIRTLSTDNNYGTSTTTTATYDYTVTGRGVDVVIQDSGLQVDHPEFQDANGNSRVQQINWYTLSGVSGTQNANHYRDYDGHGTHVAGIAAGKTYGYAKNARIYSQKLNGLEGAGDSGTGISITDAFDCIKGWHNNKPIDPITGAKRPTVVNMSWGYGAGYDTVSEVNYKGTAYTGASIDTTGERAAFGLLNIAGDSTTYITNVRIASVDTDVAEMVDAGIHVVIAAGNRSHKIEIYSGSDWSNFAITDTGTVYYHQGSSPYNSGSIIVGAMDSTAFSSTLDQKATYSETGPGVDVFAPGTNIMSCTSTTNSWGAGSQNYYWNASYRQTNINGTSMAAPQVAGVVALYLETTPKAKPSAIKSVITNKAGGAIYSTGLYEDYTSNRSVMTINPKLLYNPFGSSDKPIQLSGPNLTISANIIPETRT